MTTLDSEPGSPSDAHLAQQVATLTAENQSLRTYLARVLEMLEARADEVATPPAPPVAPAASAAQVAELERRLHQAEQSIQDLLWSTARLDHRDTVTLP